MEWFREVRYPSVLDCRDGRRCTVYYRLSSTMFLVKETDRGAKQYMMGSRWRIFATALLLSFPIVAIQVAAAAAATGECSRKGLITCSDTGIELRCFESIVRRYPLFGGQGHQDSFLSPHQSNCIVRDLACLDFVRPAGLSGNFQSTPAETPLLDSLSALNMWVGGFFTFSELALIQALTVSARSEALYNLVSLLTCT